MSSVSLMSQTNFITINIFPGNCLERIMLDNLDSVRSPPVKWTREIVVRPGAISHHINHNVQYKSYLRKQMKLCPPCPSYFVFMAWLDLKLTDLISSLGLVLSFYRDSGQIKTVHCGLWPLSGEWCIIVWRLRKVDVFRLIISCLSLCLSLLLLPPPLQL